MPPQAGVRPEMKRQPLQQRMLKYLLKLSTDPQAQGFVMPNPFAKSVFTAMEPEGGWAAS
jgi:hypothetical protein